MRLGVDLVCESTSETRSGLKGKQMNDPVVTITSIEDTKSLYCTSASVGEFTATATATGARGPGSWLYPLRV